MNGEAGIQTQALGSNLVLLTSVLHQLQERGLSVVSGGMMF